MDEGGFVIRRLLHIFRRPRPPEKLDIEPPAFRQIANGRGYRAPLAVVVALVLGAGAAWVTTRPVPPHPPIEGRDAARTGPNMEIDATPQSQSTPAKSVEVSRDERTRQIGRRSEARSTKVSTERKYYRGPRGGCYSTNSFGRKHYVEHSKCR